MERKEVVCGRQIGLWSGGGGLSMSPGHWTNRKWNQLVALSAVRSKWTLSAEMWHNSLWTAEGVSASAVVLSACSLIGFPVPPSGVTSR